MNKNRPLVRVSVIMKDGRETQQGFYCEHAATEYYKTWQGSENVQSVKWIDASITHVPGGNE